jgi:hypothetical protein
VGACTPTSSTEFLHPARACEKVHHLDAVLTDMDIHGITGAINTNCGITYTTTAKSCVHLVWYQNALHFTYKGELCEITIDRSTFNPIFKIAKEIYS